MNRARRAFWFIVVAQVSFLLGWAGWHEHVRTNSATIRLKTLPVDPRDLLRGDYMILRYEISNVKPPAAMSGVSAMEEFWVVLEPREGYHVAVASSREEPRLAPAQIAVRGWPGKRGGVDFGIETFYVPEGKGTPRFTTLEVDAAVSPTHRLHIKRVRVDGRNYP